MSPHLNELELQSLVSTHEMTSICHDNGMRIHKTKQQVV